MLIESHKRSIEGPLGDVLALVYGETLRGLMEAGYIEETADLIATRIIPRIEERLVHHGFVSRQIWEDA